MVDLNHEGVKLVHYPPNVQNKQYSNSCRKTKTATNLKHFEIFEIFSSVVVFSLVSRLMAVTSKNLDKLTNSVCLVEIASYVPFHDVYGFFTLIDRTYISKLKFYIF